MQWTQTAESLSTRSASGQSSTTCSNGFRWKVPSSAATITTLPAFASRSHVGSRSSKNWPSSMPTTSAPSIAAAASASRAQFCAGIPVASCVTTSVSE